MRFADFDDGVKRQVSVIGDAFVVFSVTRVSVQGPNNHECAVRVT